MFAIINKYEVIILINEIIFKRVKMNSGIFGIEN